MSKSIHILRYGTVAEKTHLEKAIGTYDYLSINGNSAAYVSRAIAKFVVEKFFNKPEKGFIIDPITYAFQQNIHLLKSKSKSGEITLRKSIKKLVDSYQEPANKVIEDAPIQPDDFPDNRNLLQSFCLRVLNFQYSIIEEYIGSNDLEKYLQYATEAKSGLLPQFHPKFLIAPYFYLNSKDANFDKWLRLNIDFLNESIRQSNAQFEKIDIYGQIVISKDVLLDQVIIRKIVSAYRQCDCAGFTVWVDAFDEQEENMDIFNGFIQFLQGLKGKPVYNMYGGFFSILLTHQSIQLLNGVSHGLEYGEHREVYPVGGGIPVSKYYYMPLHQRRDFTKSFYLLEHNNILDTSLPNWGDTKKYFAEICKCEQCRTVMKDEMINFVNFESDQYYEIKGRNNNITRRKKASSETKANCLYHYLFCKKMEFLMTRNRDINDVLESLIIEKEKYISSAFLENNALDYIDNWYNVISSISNKTGGGRNE